MDQVMNLGAVKQKIYGDPDVRKKRHDAPAGTRATEDLLAILMESMNAITEENGKTSSD